MTPLHYILYPPSKYFVPPLDESASGVRYRMRQNPRKQILDALQKNGGKATTTQIFDLTDGDISVPLAMHHLQIMQEEGLVTSRLGKGDQRVKGGRRSTIWFLK